MNNAPRTIPNDSRFDVVQFDILSEGRVVSAELEVMSITIAREFNRIPTAKIVIRDGDAAEANFEVSNEDFFLPGKKIIIKAGHDDQRVQLFKGIVTKQTIRVREQGNSDLIVECKDASVRMTIGRHSFYYENVKDSDVMETVIGRYAGLQPDVEATTLQHREIVQHHSTDWDFLLSRAEANGRLLLADDGILRIKKPDSGTEPVFQIDFGRGEILELEAEMDARTQLKSVRARSWDYANQRLFETEADSVAFQEGGNVSGATLAGATAPAQFDLRHSGNVSEEEIGEWAKGRMLRSRLAKIRGRAKFSGYPELKPGQTVQLNGVSNRFNGKAFVSAVRHEIYAGSWDTHVQFGLASDVFAQSPDFYDPPAAGLLPPIHGLQIGKVVQLQNDPEGQDRIQVRVPVIDNNAPGIWARVASLDAGANRGAFFRPEIDDEVIVGFVNDDPRDAIVLGMLHSSAKPAPITAQDVNHEKGFTTRSNMHLYFNDDTKTIKIDTPAGNSLVIDEQSMSIKLTDQNQNSVNMTPQGIELKSQKNITIQAGMVLTLSAGTTLSIGGANISMSADGPLSMEGATAKLSSPGITQVSGSLVTIN